MAVPRNKYVFAWCRPSRPDIRHSEVKERGYAHVQYKHQVSDRQRVSMIRQAILFKSKMEEKLVAVTQQRKHT